jgi:hypothetical protein
MHTKGLLLSGAGLAAVFASLAFLPVSGLPTAAQAAEVPKEIIAVQIRKQGYACPNPKNAHRDGETPLDDARWILECEGVTYKVTLVPNMAAKVEQVPAGSSTSSEGASEGSGQSR